MGKLTKLGMASLLLVFISVLIYAFLVSFLLPGATARVDILRDQDDRFIEKFPEVQDWNEGLVIEMKPTIQLGAPDEVNFRPMHHSSEPILAENSGFNLAGYFYDNENEAWMAVILPKWTDETFLLQPDAKETQTWVILPGYLYEDADTDMIRFFITGVGVDTGKQYGAYVDIQNR